MKALYILFLSLICFSCIKKQPLPQNSSPQPAKPKFEKEIFNMSSHFTENTNGERISIRTNEDNQISIYILKDTGSDISILSKYTIDSYSSDFILRFTHVIGVDNFKHLNILNYRAGIGDLDHDGFEEFFYLSAGAPGYYLTIVDYMNKQLTEIDTISYYIGFYTPIDTEYIVGKHILVGPSLMDESRNTYYTYSYDKDRLKKYERMPDDLFEYFYKQYESDYDFYKVQNNSSFLDLFMFLYNNRPEKISFDFVNENFVSDPEADSKYEGLQYEDPFDVYKSKFYYYDLVSKLNSN